MRSRLWQTLNAREKGVLLEIISAPEKEVKAREILYDYVREVWQNSLIFRKNVLIFSQIKENLDNLSEELRRKGLAPKSEIRRYFDILRELLSSTDVLVRYEAYKALPYLPATFHVKLRSLAMEELFYDTEPQNKKDSQIKSLAISALGILGKEYRRDEVIERLVQLLKDSRISNSAVEALVNFGPDIYQPLLSAIVGSPEAKIFWQKNADFRKAVAKLFGKMEISPDIPPELLQEIKNLLADPNMWVIIEMFQALIEIDKRDREKIPRY